MAYAAGVPAESQWNPVAILLGDAVRFGVPGSTPAGSAPCKFCCSSSFLHGSIPSSTLFNYDHFFLNPTDGKYS